MVVQTFIDEMTCHFNLREPKSKKPTIVYMVVCVGRKQTKFSTGVKVYPEQWNAKKEEAFISFRLTELDNRNNKVVNDKLASVKKDFMDYKRYLCENPDDIPKQARLLKRFIYKDQMGKKKKAISATATMKQLVTEKQSTDSTKLQHTRNINKFERFLKENKIEDVFRNMNLKTMNSYQQYLLEIGNLPKTIGNIFKGTIFPLLRRASKNIEIPFTWDESNLDSFELVKDASNKEMAMNKKVALTEEQLHTIYNFEITQDSLKPLFRKPVTEKTVERYREVRDMFLLQCYVGQRISDLQKVLKNDAVIDNEHNTISIIQQKTNSKAVIPVLPIAKELMEKYKGKGIKCYKEDNTNTVNRTIRALLEHMDGFNEKVTYQENGKTLMKPLYKLVHSHTARHTFATIMCRRGIPKDVVILATGHEDTKMIDEVYAHLTQKDKAKKVSEAFEKAFKPVEETSSSTTTILNQDAIAQFISERIKMEMKDFKADICGELEKITNHIEANKDIIQPDNAPMVVDMVVSLMKDRVPSANIINMLDASGLLYSATEVMTGTYIPIRPKKGNS